ncbi:MAG: hypothetical protein WAW80_01355 [Candidatus Saccharimonadales bacterium]
MKDVEQLLIVGVLLIVLAEVTYLVAKLPRQINTKKKYIFVDTSVLIDGRIIAVAASGFIGDTLAIPRSVIGELQFLADNADAEKRARARHGLDIARELQNLDGVKVELYQDGSKAEEGVDERLLNLAKKTGGAICTIDYNLNKVAAVEGITVCNVNELAKSLRMAYLPGERMMLEIVQKGQDSHQGVGYLKDGTMVVVEQSANHVGKTVEIEFIRSLQTAAGRMMFAKRLDLKPQIQPKLKPKTRQQVVGTKPAEKKPVKVVSKQPTRRHGRTDHEADLIDLVEKQQR